MSRVESQTAKSLFAPGPPRGTAAATATATTRDRLIDTALNLFHTYGFHAVGLDQILADVGVTKTTFYNHFESKDALMIAALERRDEWDLFDLRARLIERAGDDPRAMLLAIFDVFDEWFTEPAYQGCIFINACAEFPSPHDPIHQAASRHYVAAEASIRDMAERANARDPEQLARQIVILAEGAMTRRQVSGDHHSARHARQIAELLLREHLAPTGDGEG